MMSKRSGSVDPGLLLWLQTSEGLSAERITDALNHESGLAGLSGLSGDTRDLVRARAEGNHDAEFALDAFAHSVRHRIAAMAASLDRVDALVFTGEIGEDQPEVREMVCARLRSLGIRGGLDSTPRPGDTVISPEDAEVPVRVIATGETRQIGPSRWAPHTSTGIEG